MECEIFLGSICILLEDIGFERRQTHIKNIPMTYYYLARLSMGKVFADVNIDYTIEMVLNANNLTADRWKLSSNGIYMTVAELEVDMHDPSSLSSIVNFVQDTINFAD